MVMDRRLYLESDFITEVWQSTPTEFREDIYFIDSLMLDLYFKKFDPLRMQRALDKQGFPKRFLLMPVNIAVDGFKHWFLIACDRESNRCVVYDSIRGLEHGEQLSKTVFKRLQQYNMIDEDSTLTVDTWYPQQADGFSCGYRTVVAMLLIALRGRLLIPSDNFTYITSVNSFISSYHDILQTPFHQIWQGIHDDLFLILCEASGWRSAVGQLLDRRTASRGLLHPSSELVRGHCFGA